MITNMGDCIEIEYYGLYVTICGQKYAPDCWDDLNVYIDWTYKADYVYVTELIADLIPEEEYISNNVNLNDSDSVYKYIDENIDDLLVRFETKIKKYFKKYAIEDAEENYDWRD